MSIFAKKSVKVSFGACITLISGSVLFLTSYFFPKCSKLLHCTESMYGHHKESVFVYEHNISIQGVILGNLPLALLHYSKILYSSSSRSLTAEDQVSILL